MRFKKYFFCYDQYSYLQDRIITHHVSIYAKNIREAESKLEKLGYKDLYLKKKKRKVSY